MYPSDKGVIAILKGVAGKTKSKVAKELVADKDYEDACSAAHQLFYEMMEEVKEGEMSWKEAVEDLRKNLLAIEMPKHPESEEESEEDGEEEDED